MFPPSTQAVPPPLTWEPIWEWARAHYRDRTFAKDERIPARPGLLYLVERGLVRLVGSIEAEPEGPTPAIANPQEPEASFLGLVGAGQPFELVAQPPLALQAYAHRDQTVVLWLYWHDLDAWPAVRQDVLQAFRDQHQRKLLWLGILAHRRTIDRLLGFLMLLMAEHGEPHEHGHCLPFPLTHAQIGSAIGSTRVTVTRLLGKLQQKGLLFMENETYICLPAPKIQEP